MIVTVAFGKGGTAKTSTAAAMVNYARMHGRSVLAIDSDPQANFTFALKGNAAGRGLYDVLTGGLDAADVIQDTEQVPLIAAGLNLATAETAIAGKPGRDFIMKKALEPLANSYDLIVIDTQPDLNSLLINALTASDTVLLPMQANSFSVMGLYQMRETIGQVQKYCNPSLTVAGIVLTRYKARQTLAKDMRETVATLAAEMGTRLFDTFIREGVAVEQAQSMQQSLFEFAPNSNPAKDYESLFREMELI